MRVLFSLVALFLFTAAQAQTQWEHNGSIVTLFADGANRQFKYSVPRDGLPVTEGTLLFSGRKSGDSYAGTAFSFSSKCGTLGYSVSGPVAADQRTVTMYGKMPRRDGSCRVVRYDDDVLVFSFQDPAETASVNGGHDVTICMYPVFVEESRLKETIDGDPATTEHVLEAINYLHAKYCRDIPQDQPQPEEIVAEQRVHVWDNCHQLAGLFRGETVYFVQCYE